jgi:predicted membrane protein
MPDNDPKPTQASDKWDARQAKWQAKWDRRQARWEARQARWGGTAPYRGRHATGGLVVGLIITIIGVLFLLQNLGIRFFDNVWDFWPVILIVLGVSRATTAYGWGGRMWGGILITVGGIFLLENLDILPFIRWGNLWPLILMVVGVGMLAKNLERQHNARNATATAASCPTIGTRVRGVTSASTLHEWAVFSGVRRKVESQEFEGGEVTAVFGGAEIDLRGAAMKNAEAIVDVNAVFGGVEIRTPETWEIVMSGTPIFGGYEDETAPARGSDGEKRPRLIIAGSAVFGGVSVKN